MQAGGRSQELVLAIAPCMALLHDVPATTLATDGTDGLADAAGAIAAADTAQRGAQRGLSIDHHLADNDAYHFCQALGELIITGPTATDGNDLRSVFAF
jgi:glycerate 2-kinase